MFDFASLTFCSISSAHDAHPAACLSACSYTPAPGQWLNKPLFLVLRMPLSSHSFPISRGDVAAWQEVLASLWCSHQMRLSVSNNLHFVKIRGVVLWCFDRKVKMWTGSAVVTHGARLKAQLCITPVSSWFSLRSTRHPPSTADSPSSQMGLITTTDFCTLSTLCFFTSHLFPDSACTLCWCFPSSSNLEVLVDRDQGREGKEDILSVHCHWITYSFQ